MDSTGYNSHCDSLTHIGQIKYGSFENELLIEYSNDSSVTLRIDKEGVLSKFPTNYCHGEFEGKDKLQLHLRWGGLGSGIIHDVEGDKK